MKLELHKCVVSINWTNLSIRNYKRLDVILDVAWTLKLSLLHLLVVSPYLPLCFVVKTM